MVSRILRLLKVFTCVVLIAQMIGCGTLMYPNRRGQREGRIDPGVAVLDGVGLLLFILPGVIAFAIDFGSGAIYLPGTSRSSLDLKHVRVVKFDPKRYSNESLEKIIKKETGLGVKLNQANMQVIRLKSIDDVRVNLAKAFTKEIN